MSPDCEHLRREPGIRPGARRCPRRCRLVGVVAVIVVLPALVACGPSGPDGDEAPAGAGAAADREAEVAGRGAAVMPFDLDATTHRFEETDDGLVQTVVVDVPDAPGGDDQVALVREHLSAEAESFARGDFGDPATIHGDEMPGLAALVAGAAGVEVTYTDVRAGGRITYVSDDPALVTALHLWGDAQVTDHGGHAEHVDGDDETHDP